MDLFDRFKEFFKGADTNHESQKPSLMGAVELLNVMGIPGFDDGATNAISRVYFADGEDLAEGGIAAWFTEIQPFLESQNVKTDITDNIDDNGIYTVTSAGKSFVIYEGDCPELWGLASVKAMQITNTLLEDTGSEERVYGLYTGGNEGIVLFMTPDTYETLVADPRLDPSDCPDDPGTIDNPRVKFDNGKLVVISE